MQFNKVFTVHALIAIASVSAAGVSGASALEFTRHAVAFGPRPSGSEANRQLQAYILTQLKTASARSPKTRSLHRPPRAPSR